MRSLMKDKQGIFYTVVVIVIVLFVTDISYLVLSLTQNKFFDAFTVYTEGNIYLQNLQSTLRYVGPITIVVLNVGLILLLVVSPWKRGSNEVEDLQL